MRLTAPLLLVLLAIGCSARPDGAWQPERAEAVAWWIEDVAHGLSRLPGEVDMLDAGPGDAAIARWAAGSRQGETWVPPRQLAARRARWPSLHAAIAEGLAVPAGGDGLLAPAPATPPQRRREIETLVDAENGDRRFLDGLVIGIGAADPGVERAYRAAARAAREKLDQPAR